MNGDYTVAIWATIGLVIVFTVPVVWQFLQPNDDDFGDLTKRPEQVRSAEPDGSRRIPRRSAALRTVGSALCR